MLRIYRHISSGLALCIDNFPMINDNSIPSGTFALSPGELLGESGVIVGKKKLDGAKDQL